MEKFKYYSHILVSAILSGIMIGIGASVFLLVAPMNKIIASFLFGFGLFVIIHFKLFLFTGKVGFLLDYKSKYIVDLIVGLIGNFIGIVAFCFIFKLTRYGTTLEIQAIQLVEIKQNDQWFSILLLSIFCGMMIYLAVKGHQKAEYGVGKALICFLGIAIFILCGFEHCIANAAYYAYAGILNWKVFGYFILMILGNSIGSIILDAALKLYDYLKKEDVDR